MTVFASEEARAARVEKLRAALAGEFEKRMEFREGPRARVLLTLTPWEVRELVRRALAVFEPM